MNQKDHQKVSMTNSFSEICLPAQQEISSQRNMEVCQIGKKIFTNEFRSFSNEKI